MKINAPPGQGILSTTDNAENLLLQSMPYKNYTIETRVFVDPIDNFQGAGLLIYQDDSNFLQLIRAFCEGPNLQPCIGNAIYFDHEEEGQFIGPNYAIPLDTPSGTFLRIKVRGDKYTGYVSSDGNDWVRVGSHTFNTSRAPIKAGLVASGAVAMDFSADFDYFLVDAKGNARFPIVGSWTGIDNYDGSIQTIRFKNEKSGRFPVNYYDDGASYCGVDDDGPIYSMKLSGYALRTEPLGDTYQIFLSGKCPHKGPTYSGEILHYFDPLSDTLSDEMGNTYERE